MSALELYDAVVVGAGPAGSMTARQLARGGWRTLLLDSLPRGRDRVCGGFLGPENAPLLAAAGLSEAFERLPKVPLDHVTFTVPGLTPVTVPLPGRGGWGLDRRRFDAWLCDQAEAAGAHVSDRTELVSAQHQRHGWQLALKHGQTPRVVCSRVLIRAHGRRQPDGQRSLRGKVWFACKAAYAGMAAPGAVSLHFVAGAHVGFNQRPDGLTIACFFARHERLTEAGGNPDRLLKHMGEENPSIREAMRGARRVDAWIGCRAHPDRERRFADGGAFCVGDAVTMVNPIVGGGISVALGSAELLSRVLLADGARSPHEAVRRYGHAWRRAFSGRWRLARWLGAIEGSPHATEWLLRALRAHPAALDAIIRFFHPEPAAIRNRRTAASAPATIVPPRAFR